MSSTKLFHYSVICHKALNIVSDNARALPINNMSALSGGKISLCHNTGFILASAKWQSLSISSSSLQNQRLIKCEKKIGYVSVQKYLHKTETKGSVRDPQGTRKMECHSKEEVMANFTK